MIDRTATIIGATGLIGSHLLKLIQIDDYFTTIRVLVRRPIKINNVKTEVKLIDFNDAESFRLGVDGSDAVFCGAGTTQQKVKGDKEAYRKVDYDIPVKAAQYCAETGCTKFLLVSSVGASAKSNQFYLRLKGEVEAAVKEKGIPSVSIFRPSLLLGNRKEKRTGELMGKVIAQTFSFVFINGLKKYKPVHAKNVAQAMLLAAKQAKQGFFVYEYEEMQTLLK